MQYTVDVLWERETRRLLRGFLKFELSPSRPAYVLWCTYSAGGVEVYIVFFDGCTKGLILLLLLPMCVLVHVYRNQVLLLLFFGFRSR